MPSSNHPNILWICSDQQRFDTLGCYGNSSVSSPNIDRLAQTGVLFEQAYSQSPVCTPSRASFLTGRYPRTTRDRQNGQSIPADERLITKFLADQGYQCGLSGKLHLSVCNPSVGHASEPRIDDGYSEFHWSHHPAPDWPANEYIQWLDDKGISFHTPNRPDCKYVQIGMPAEHHQTTWCVEKAMDFIHAHANGDNPWLFSINIYDPHHAFDPAPEYLEPYLKNINQIPLPNYQPGELDNKPIFQQQDHLGGYANPNLYPYHEMSEYDHRMVKAAYWAMCDLIDAQVGRLIATLKETAQYENTIVVYMSDHGEMLGDHGIYLKGPYFYEEAVHVPMIVSWPGRIEAGRRISSLVELMDIAPTLLEAAGFEPLPGMQAMSLWPALQGLSGHEALHNDVYCEYYNAMPWHKVPAAYATMLRSDNYKLVAVHGLNTGELYDLANDPGENHNLWNDPAYQSIKLDLYIRLCDRMAWTVDPLPQREAAW